MERFDADVVLGRVEELEMQVATLTQSLELALQSLKVASTIIAEQRDRVELAHEGLDFFWEIQGESLERIVMLETFCKGKGKGKMFPPPLRRSLDQPSAKKGKGKGKGKIGVRPPDGSAEPPLGQGTTSADSVKSLQRLISRLSSRFNGSSSSASSD